MCEKTMQQTQTKPFLMMHILSASDLQRPKELPEEPGLHLNCYLKLQGPPGPFHGFW